MLQFLEDKKGTPSAAALTSQERAELEKLREESKRLH